MATPAISRMYVPPVKTGTGQTLNGTQDSTTLAAMSLDQQQNDWQNVEGQASQQQPTTLAGMANPQAAGSGAAPIAPVNPADANIPQQQNRNGGALATLPENLANQYQQTLGEMMSGAAFDPYRTQQSAAFTRAAQQARARTANANIGRVGQGTAIAQQQATENAIVQGAGETALNAEIGKQQMQQQGLENANTLAQMNLQEKMQEKQLASTENMAAADRALREKELSESSRQFNISNESDLSKFRDKLKYDYDSLSQQDKQWLAGFGLDKDKFDEAKNQWSKEFGLSEKVQLGDLSLREQGFVENVRQFNSKLAWEQEAKRLDLSDAEATRIWQASENEKAGQRQVQIATMQNDTERWKQDQVTKLTTLGWDREDARAAADREMKVTQAALDRSLNREIEAGRLSQADKALAEQARQFNTEQDFKKYALERGYSEAAIDRTWKTNERIGAEAFESAQADKQIAATKYIEEQRLSREDARLAQQAVQFSDEMTFKEQMRRDGIEQAAIDRAWKSAEAVAERVHDAEMKTLDRKLTEKGLNLGYLMQNLEGMDPKQAAAVLQEVAVDAGMEYQLTDEKGNPLTDGEGNPIMRGGLQNYKPQYTQEAAKIMEDWKPGTKITGDGYTKLIGAYDTLVDKGSAATAGSIESIGATVRWNTSGWNRWTLNDNAKQWLADNTGKLYKAGNGRVYEVVGAESGSTGRKTTQGILFRDVQTGAIVTYRNASGTQGSNSGFPA